MDPDQTARMRRLVWIHAGRKAIMLVCGDAAHLSLTLCIMFISLSPLIQKPRDVSSWSLAEVITGNY
jgi:hypothetical protein